MGLRNNSDSSSNKSFESINVSLSWWRKHIPYRLVLAYLFCWHCHSRLDRWTGFKTYINWELLSQPSQIEYDWWSIQIHHHDYPSFFPFLQFPCTYVRTHHRGHKIPLFYYINFLHCCNLHLYTRITVLLYNPLPFATRTHFWKCRKHMAPCSLHSTLHARLLKIMNHHQHFLL